MQTKAELYARQLERNQIFKPDADGGRFVTRVKSAAAPVVAPVVVVTLTRQQRRQAEKFAAKGKPADVAEVVARVWDEVTEGRGVVLVDGKPVKGGRS